MSAQFTRTLGQLLTTHKLYAGCTHCRRVHELNLGRRVERYGLRALVDDIRQRVRCLRLIAATFTEN